MPIQPPIPKNCKIRSVWDDTSKKRWFSVVDICAAITGADYQSARNYWKWLKRKLIMQNNELATTYKQLQFVACDGRLRFTDVMDKDEVLQLILICPSQKAEAVKLWIAKLIASGANVLQCLEEAITNAKPATNSIAKSAASCILKIVKYISLDIHNEKTLADPKTVGLA